ncbi:MAG: ribosome biogenesis GTP-binding protein YihA/YsxC [Rikenellaceae bacterium]|jgi:GTP-binding protein|nr:ribosome biogenesis GTP-binding protein YihA/YsxC [Rikenellaceae bacterium]
MKITSATFTCSNSKSSQCPADSRPEFAFIGRSNVGKSSLINMLTDHKGLAKVSGTPGKTRLINHFLINNQWYLVDLPGYGYARVSKSERSGFSQLILDYINNRRQLVCLFVLIDSRLEPQKIDTEFIDLLGEKGIPFALIFTKIDKLTQNQLDSNLARYRRFLRQSWEELPPMLVSSAEKKTGQQEILAFIETCIERVTGGTE